MKSNDIGHVLCGCGLFPFVESDSGICDVAFSHFSISNNPCCMQRIVPIRICVDRDCSPKMED